MVAAAPLRRTGRAGERGGILLVVLMLSVTCSLLAMALVSTAEVTLRASINADDLDRAERAACSGVEWGAATVKAGGFLGASRSVRLGKGVEVAMQVRVLQTPEVLGTGRSNGAEVTVGADVGFLERGKAYALSSYDGTNSLGHPVQVDGAAYLGDRSAPLDGNGALTMAGDLDVVSTNAITKPTLTHTSGTTSQGVAARTMPAWNTVAFASDLGWSVPITRYSGNTVLQNVTLTGLVVVTLGAGQTLTLDDVTIDGTLVVPWLYPPVLDLLGTATIELKDVVKIQGGTADTGNLAVLAPGCTLRDAGVTTVAVTGVTYALALQNLRSTTFDGMVLLRNRIASTRGPMRFTRAADFLADVPVGIEFGASDRVVIHWRGRQ